MRIAVVGSGITGLVAAWALSQPRSGEVHEVVLYEAAPRLGGHSHTIDAAIGGETVPVDTGFIVYNTRNYPHLVRSRGRDRGQRNAAPGAAMDFMRMVRPPGWRWPRRLAGR